MSLGRTTGSTPLDDFLAGSDSSTETGELLQRIGLIGSLVGITLAAGLVVFLLVVHRGARREVSLLLRVAMAAGFVALAGAAVEIAGTASLLDSSWADTVTDSAASASMMRLLAGLLITLGLANQPLAVGAEQEGEPELETAGGRDDSDASTSAVRWVPGSASAFGVGGAVFGVLSFMADGHTVTEGPRVVHAITNAVHVAAGSIWFGGVVALVVLSFLRRSAGPSTAPLVVKFSSVATYALIAVAFAGGLMSLMITDGFGDYTGTDWGRALIIKTAAVAVVVAIGAYNHFVVVPALERDPESPVMLGRVRASLTAEAIVLLFVAIATVFLTVASTN